MAATQIRNGQIKVTTDFDIASNKLTNVTDPASAQDAATKAYVDARVNGLLPKGGVRAVATSNVASLSGTTTIDGVSLGVNDRVLLVAQTSGAENGIWLVQSSTWTRPTDYASGSTVDAVQGAYTLVEDGTVNKGTGYVLTTTGTITIDTTATVWQVFVSAATVTAADASIDVSGGTSIKVHPGTNGQIMQTVSGVQTPVSMSGDATIASGGAVTIAASTFLAAHLATRETPSGTINGSNQTFTLAHTPVSGTEMVFLNGQLLDAGGADYSISTLTITMTIAPVSGDVIRVTYWY